MGRPKKAAPVYVEPEEESQDVEEEEPADDEEEAVTEFNREHQVAPASSGTVSKAEAVRLAVAAGMEKPEEGVAWIKKHHGIDLAKPMWSSYRSQQKAREEKKAGGQPAPATPRKQAAPAALRQAAPATQTAASGDPGLLSDLAAVKHLVERLGVEQVKQIADLFG